MGSGPFLIDRTPGANGAYLALHGGDRREPPVSVSETGGGLGPYRDGEDDSFDPLLPLYPHFPWSRPTLFVSLCTGQATCRRAELGLYRTGRPRSAPTSTSLSFCCAPAGAYADSPTECGAVQCRSCDVRGVDRARTFTTAYPSLLRLPLPEYSEVFFGYTNPQGVLAPCCVALCRDFILTTSENGLPIPAGRFFAGIRCASDDVITYHQRPTHNLPVIHPSSSHLPPCCASLSGIAFLRAPPACLVRRRSLAAPTSNDERGKSELFEHDQPS